MLAIAPRRAMTLAAAALASIMAALLPRSATSRQRGPDVPNFPTPPTSVAAMLKLAGVTKEDTVYDLGCGDGRIVIAAAEKIGAKGVGVDIDPQCVKESQTNARRAGVEERVRFWREDLFKTDISRATVVALYLSPELNRRLIPKLLKELAPGTRIVSHVYDMGDWSPDKVIPAPGSTKYKLFLWTVPSAVSGGWRWMIHTVHGDQGDSLQFNQRFQTLSGTFSVNGKELALKAGKVDGARVHFDAGDAGSGVIVSADLSVIQSGGKQPVVTGLRGNLDIQGGPLAGSYPVTIRRARFGTD